MFEDAPFLLILTQHDKLDSSRQLIGQLKYKEYGNGAINSRGY